MFFNINFNRSTDSWLQNISWWIGLKPFGRAQKRNMTFSYNCYIPIFYFKLRPKFPFLFHTPMFPMSSYSILWRFQRFWCFPYSDVFLFCTPMFPMFPAVFWHLSALRCSPYSDISKILLFHSMLRCFPMFSLFL